MKHLIPFGLLLFLFISTDVSAQESITSTSISGKVTDLETGEPIKIGTVALYKDGSLVTGTDSDFDGHYLFENLEPGLYDIEVSYVGYENKRMRDVLVKTDRIITVDVAITEGVIIHCCSCGAGYKVPLIDFWDTTSGAIFNTERIEKLPIK